jgi:hypothetical protein
MSAPSPSRARPRKIEITRGHHEGHIHLPSVHVRSGGIGFDYSEDLFVRRRGRKQFVERRVRLECFSESGGPLIRETVDVLSPEELAEIEGNLLALMDEENPDTQVLMQRRAEAEFERQRRIEAGVEQACRSCGCSNSRSCSLGCVWATQTLCSRCV